MSTAEYDFPTIEAPPIPVTPPAKLLAVVAPETDKPPSIKATVLAQFKTAAVGIVALATKYANVAYDCSTTKGMADAVAARRDLRENGRLFLTPHREGCQGRCQRLEARHGRRSDPAGRHRGAG